MNIGFIGAGNMGQAYITALKKDNEIFFIEKNDEVAENIIKSHNSNRVQKIEDLVKSCDYIFLAVKPQIMDLILYELKTYDISNKIFITIAAGKSIKYYKNILGEDLKLSRVMPNTPVLIGKGISGVSFTKNMQESEIKNIMNLLSLTGRAIILPEEKIDMITPISGSSPAFIFTLINAFADGGVKIGLTKKEALEFAYESFIGAASMIKETGLHPEVLKDMVTSPAGTTAYGLASLEKNGVRNAMIEAVVETYNRTKELGEKED